MKRESEPRSGSSHRGLNVAVWIVQVTLGLTFVGTAVWKVVTPITELAAKMPWMGQVSPGFLYLTALFDLLGGLGVLLPSLTRIKPGLTVLASLGVVLLMASAIVFHLSRGEGANTPFNFFVIALAAFVGWARWTKVPIPPRNP